MNFWKVLEKTCHAELVSASIYDYRQFMFVVVKVYNSRVGNGGKLFYKPPVNRPLHFDGADHAPGESAVEPFVNPFEQAFGIADYKIGRAHV